MSDETNPDAGGTDPGMTYGEWKTGGVPKRDAASEKDRADMRAVLAGVVARAPEPPSVDEVAARIAVASGPARRGPDAGPARAGSTAGDGSADAGDDVADYVALTRSSGGGTRPGSRWQRVALAAAAILAVVAVGAVVLGDRDEPKDDVFTDRPEVPVAPGPDEALAMVPGELPDGLVPIWVSSGVSDEGDRFAAVHYGAPEIGDDGLPVGRRLRVESVVVDPDEVDLVADARESGSLEDWDGREVVVTDDGATAQFVDPAGIQVLVQGDPTAVRAVVPTLQVLSGADWEAFVDDMSTEVEALPVVAAFELIPNDLAQGVLMFPEVTTGSKAVRVSVHGDPAAVDSGAAPAGGEGGSGVVAGTCLTVDDVTACRPGELLGEVAGGVQSSSDVLIDDHWWHFGWTTNELTEVTVTPDQGSDGGWGVRWAYEGTGHGDPMSWYATVLPTDATQIQVELTSAGGAGSGFNSLRPAH